MQRKNECRELGYRTYFQCSQLSQVSHEIGKRCPSWDAGGLSYLTALRLFVSSPPSFNILRNIKYQNPNEINAIKLCETISPITSPALRRIQGEEPLAGAES